MPQSTWKHGKVGTGFDSHRSDTHPVTS